MLAEGTASGWADSPRQPSLRPEQIMRSGMHCPKTSRKVPGKALKLPFLAGQLSCVSIAVPHRFNAICPKSVSFHAQ